MNSVATSMVIVPGVVALMLFLVFTYLYEQSRQDYFRAWQLSWAAYTLHYGLDAWAAFRQPSAAISFLASLLLVAMAVGAGRRVSVVQTERPELTVGINDRVQLAEAERLLRSRIAERHMRNGVTIVDPSTTHIDAAVEIGQDARIEP